MSTDDPYGPPSEGDGGQQQPPPPPPYGAPPQYGAPPPGYGAPPQYGAPPPGYGGPPQYGAAPGYGYGYGYARPASTNGFAIASLICAFLCSPLGLIFGFIAKSQIRRSGEQGNGLATAGIAISAISLVLGVIWVIAVAAATSNVNGY